MPGGAPLKEGITSPLHPKPSRYPLSRAPQDSPVPAVPAARLRGAAAGQWRASGQRGLCGGSLSDIMLGLQPASSFLVHEAASGLVSCPLFQPTLGHSLLPRPQVNCAESAGVGPPPHYPVGGDHTQTDHYINILWMWTPVFLCSVCAPGPFPQDLRS